MSNSIIAEGKTTNEAIENGLKQLKVSKKMVDIKVLESEEKRSFFSILAPRVVILTEKEQEEAEKNIEKFLKELKESIKEEFEYEIVKTSSKINVNLNGEGLGYLIGYRGETLYAMQNIMSTIAGKGIQNRVRVILDIQGYKEKREKTLEELAKKVAKTVIRTKKPIKLEPMQAYERKIIHSALQENEKIETISVGEEPHRRIVISLKK